MKGMPIRNGYYVLAQQLRVEIIRAPNTTKKFNELLFVFFIGKECLPVWWCFRIFTNNNQFFTATSALSSNDFMEFSKYMSVLKILSDFLTTISNSLAQMSLKWVANISDSKKPHCHH